MNQPKIIIIGAGASGIAAGTRLIQNGFDNLTILEAENRIGGRINSVNYDGTMIDLGAQWCHGEKGNVVYELVKDLNLLSSSFNDYLDNTFYLCNGQVLDKSVTDNLFAIAMSIFENTKFESNELSLPFGKYFIDRYKKRVNEELGDNPEILEISQLIQEWFHKFFNCLDATKSWFDITVGGAHQFQSCEGDFQLNWGNRGYRTILDVLMKKIPNSDEELPIGDKICLSKKVNKIIWDSNSSTNGATIKCTDGSSYQADHVIITVSLGVLKNLLGDCFEPPLPKSKENVIRNMCFGTCNKVLLKFPTKWWPNDFKGISLVWSEEDKQKVLKEFGDGGQIKGRSWLEEIFGFYVIDSHPKMLLGWVVGETAEYIESLSDETVIKGCMFLLKRFAGKNFEIPQPDGLLRSKWKSNSNFCGSYTHCGIEAEKNFAYGKDLAEPVITSDNNNNKPVLLFAGEGTHMKYFSTVHGAIESGFREADRIINIYKVPKQKFTKIAIIGAGIAGLSAAKTLLDLGYKDLIILEAQTKPGGRINTIRYGDEENEFLELGAQFIHGKLNSLYDLAEKHNLIAEETSEEGLGIYVRDNGEIVDSFLVKQVDFEIGKILEKCTAFLDSLDYPRSVGDYVETEFFKYLTDSDRKTKDIKLELLDWHRRFQNIDNSCMDWKDLSAKFWGQYVCQEDGAHINLKNGYQSLIKVLVGSFPEGVLFLSTPVTDIQCRDKKLVIRSQEKTFVCDHLIITTSLGVLKGFARKIPQSSPTINQTIDKIGFYGIGKVFLIFPYNWWKVDGIQLLWRKDSVLDDEEEWLRDISGFDPVLNQPNVLLGWIGGKGLKIMEGLSEEIVGIHCLKLLRKFMTSYTIPEPVKVIRTRWCSNPWIKGGYSHLTRNCDSLSENSTNHSLSQPISIDGNLRILLAGEATDPTQYSTTHGAFESGKRQAIVLHKYLIGVGNSKL